MNITGNRVIRTPRVANIMKMVDRGDFCMSNSTSYDDAPQSIGFAVTISAPHMVLRLKLLVQIISYAILKNII